jgi:hypothetical protein
LPLELERVLAASAMGSASVFFSALRNFTYSAMPPAERNSCVGLPRALVDQREASAPR